MKKNCPDEVGRPPEAAQQASEAAVREKAAVALKTAFDPESERKAAEPEPTKVSPAMVTKERAGDPVRARITNPATAEYQGYPVRNTGSIAELVIPGYPRFLDEVAGVPFGFHRCRSIRCSSQK